MATSQDRVPLPGSDKQPVPGAQVLGPARADEHFQVTVRVRARTSIRPLAADNTQADLLPSQRNYVSRETYTQTYGADPQDIAKVAAFATSNGLVVVSSNEAERNVILSGTTATFSAAFGVALQEYE